MWNKSPKQNIYQALFTTGFDFTVLMEFPGDFYGDSVDNLLQKAVSTVSEVPYAWGIIPLGAKYHPGYPLVI